GRRGPELGRQAGDGEATGRLDAAGGRGVVGAGDGPRRECKLQAGPVMETPEPLHLGRERRRRLFELRVERDVVPGTKLAGQLGQDLLAGRIDEERPDIVRELVTRRALDRPVAQRLAGRGAPPHPGAPAPPPAGRAGGGGGGGRGGGGGGGEPGAAPPGDGRPRGGGRGGKPRGAPDAAPPTLVVAKEPPMAPGLLV